jgi:hypothetical protein
MMMKTNLETRGQRGAAMIEFALVLPVLLIVLLGTVEFSLLLYDKAMITNASREGARLGIVWDLQGSLTHPTCADVETRADQYLKNNLINYNLITFADTKPSPIITSCIYPKDVLPAVLAAPCLTDCTGGFGTEKPGDLLKVEVSYTYDFLVLDILPRLLLGRNDLDLKSVTIMRFE